MNAPLPNCFLEKAVLLFSFSWLHLSGQAALFTFLAELPASGIATAVDPGMMIRTVKHFNEQQPNKTSGYPGKRSLKAPLPLAGWQLWP